MEIIHSVFIYFTWFVGLYVPSLCWRKERSWIGKRENKGIRIAVDGATFCVGTFFFRV